MGISKRSGTPARIRAAAREIARLFRPTRIVLFGSHAAGRAGAASDVDLLVAVESADPIGLAGRILEHLGGRFPMDLLVRSRTDLASALKRGDTFLADILAHGRVLYEARRSRAG